MKYLLVLLLALGLAACDLGASSPSAEPLPSIGDESMAADHSMSPEESMDDDDDESGSPDASSATGMTCEEAFEELDVADLADVTSLDAASDVLDDTIASCGNVADWESELSAAVPTLDVDEAEAFLDERCDENDEIDDTPICEELED
jgi:hypothetical protein